MICDAHIHVGYFNRKGYDEPYYYSPRRVCSVLRRCGVDEFIFSSTSMQTRGIVFRDVHKEAREVARVWGCGAHPFLWVTKDYLRYDPQLAVLDEGLYEGVKLHGRETPWLGRGMSRSLRRVLDIAQARRLPIIVHTGLDEESHPKKWLKWAMRYPTVRFDFAHGAPFDVIAPCLAMSANVFVDLSCVGKDDARLLQRSRFAERILWGTDFPTLASRTGVSLMQVMRESCLMCKQWSTHVDFAGNFHRFVRGEK